MESGFLIKSYHEACDQNKLDLNFWKIKIISSSTKKPFHGKNSALKTGQCESFL